MDYVPQEVGMYDTSYTSLDEPICRGCHGASLAERHHGTEKGLFESCSYCHGVDSDYTETNCVASGCHGGVDPYANGWHHMTNAAHAGECIFCHDHNLIDSPNVPRESSNYPPSRVTPTPSSCQNCHWRQAKAGDHPRNDSWHTPESYPVVSTYESHHMSFKGPVADKCYLCHGLEPIWDLSNPGLMRHCEKCHTPNSLHRIKGHMTSGDSWEAVGDQSAEQSIWQPTVFRIFLANEKCFGCHGDNLAYDNTSPEEPIYSEYNGFAVSEDCRYCHRASVADRHHMTEITNRWDCSYCHESFAVSEDCRYCHGASVADRHHTTEIVNGNCLGCHPPATSRGGIDWGNSAIFEAYAHIEGAWITNLSGDSNGIFHPGDNIRYHIKYRLEGDPQTLYKVVGRVHVSGAFTDSLREVQWPPAGTTYWMNIDGRIPFDASPGKAKTIFKIKLKKVDASEQPPTIINFDKSKRWLEVK